MSDVLEFPKIQSCCTTTTRDHMFQTRRRVPLTTWSLKSLYTPLILAPCDFFLFPGMKRDLKGNRYANDDEVKAAVREWIQSKDEEFFMKGILKWVARWERCVAPGGTMSKNKYVFVANKLVFIFFLNFANIFIHSRVMSKRALFISRAS